MQLAATYDVFLRAILHRNLSPTPRRATQHHHHITSMLKATSKLPNIMASAQQKRNIVIIGTIHNFNN
jgi:hypothetical protein